MFSYLRVCLYFGLYGFVYICACVSVYMCLGVPVLWYVLVCVFVYELFVSVLTYKYVCVHSTSGLEIIRNFLQIRKVALLNMVLRPTGERGGVMVKAVH